MRRYFDDFRACCAGLLLVVIAFSGCKERDAANTTSAKPAEQVAPEFTGEDWKAVGVGFKEPAPAAPQIDERSKKAAEARKELRKFVGHRGEITGVAFSADGTRALSASKDGTVRLWDAETGNEVRMFDDGLTGEPRCVTFSRDGTLAIAGCSDGTVHVWDAESGKSLHVLAKHQTPVYYVASSPRGSTLVSVDESGRMILSDLGKSTSTEMLSVFAFRGQRYYPIFESHDDQLLLPMDARDVARWKADGWEQAKATAFGAPLPNARLIQSDSRHHLIAANRRTIVFLHPQPGKPPRAGKPRASSLDRIHQIAPVTGSEVIAAVGGDGAVEYWRPEDETTVGQYPMPAKDVTVAAWNPANLQALSGHADGTLTLWQLPRPFFNARDEESGLMRNLARHFIDGHFDILDEVAGRYRHDRKELASHEPELAVFYEALDYPLDEERDWTKHYARLQQWQSAKPKSVTPRIIEAKALIREGWQARGPGYGETVTREGWKVLHERLEKALQVLAAAAKLPDKDPEIYRLALFIHRSINMPRDSADQAFQVGQTIDPYYFPLYEEMCQYLLPRWHGAQGEIAQWSAAVCDGLPERGDEFYARMACNLIAYENLDFQGALGMDLQRIRRGLDQMKPDYREDRWLLNCGALFACLAGDDVTAHENFQRIGEFPERLVWRHEQTFHDFVRWADPKRARGQEKATFFDPGLWLRSLAFTADGKFFATVTLDYRTPLKIWSVESGKVIHRLPGGGIPLYDVVFHPAAPTLVIAVSGRELRTRKDFDPSDPDEDAGRQRDAPGRLAVWNLLKRGEEPEVLYDHGVRRIAITADSQVLAASCMDKKVRIWKLLSSEPPIELPQLAVANDLSFSPDGKRLATHIGGLVQVWHIESAKTVAEIGKGLPGLGGRRSLRFSPDGKLLTFSNMNGQLVLWDIEKESARHVLSLKPAVNLYQTAFSPDGRLLATGDDGHSIRLWELATGKELHEFRGHHTMLIAVEFLADGKTVASAAYDGTIKLWDASKWVE